jgi:outer membrane receptor protein involved in Fe transport
MARTAATVLAFVTAAVAAPLALVPEAASAQQPAPRTGRITGRVVDAKTGTGLTDVGVQVVGTTIGTMSGVDGRFTINGVAAGTATLQARRIGYAPKTVTGIAVPAGGAVAQDIALGTATVQLQAVAVTAAAERGTVSAALDQQRTATGIVNAITVEQISKSPDSDAAAAVGRVSGVTVQDNKYVFVRGLGERYTTASLNGARIPSSEPERKVVPLDLFPSGLIQTVTTAKTFTPDLQGDFSGAQVDITTREFPAERRVAYSVTSGMNSLATGRTVLRAPIRNGLEWLGFASGVRALPDPVRDRGAFGTLAPSPEINALARTFRNRWTPRSETGLPNYSASASAGGQAPIGARRVGYLASLSYSQSQEVRANEQTGSAVAGNGGAAQQYLRFDGETGRQSFQVGGLLNLSTLIGRTRLSLNNTYTRTADSEAREDSGLYEPLNGSPIRRSTLRYVERGVRSTQLRGEHALSSSQQLDWSVTSAGVRRNEPDRADLVYVRDEDPVTGERRPYALLEQSLSSSRRTFADLREDNLSADVRHRISFGPAERQATLRTGLFARATRRDAENQQYNFQLRPNALTQEQRQLPAELLFNGQFVQDASRVFNLQQVGSGGSYDARDDVAAGFAMVEYPLSERLRLIGGARLERADIRVRTELTTGSDTTATLANTDLLPSLALNIQLTEGQSVRLSASQTLARPEYRELSPVNFFEVLGGGVLFGNAGLRRSLIQNYDVRWEWYPAAAEIVSVSLFGKRFRDPIERVDVATSGEPQVTFVNAVSATNYGVELELRKGLGFLGAPFEPLSVFSNATIMKSTISVGNESLISNTNNDRAMVGQAPYVVNGGVAYAGGRTSATLLYNRVGRRILSAGANPLPDSYELPRDVVDLSLRVPLRGALSARFDAKNLLDSPIRVMQGPVVRERYQVGRVIGAGLSWQP